MTPEQREQMITAALHANLNVAEDGWVHSHKNDIWNVIASAHDAAILAERERCAKVAENISLGQLGWGLNSGVIRRIAAAIRAGEEGGVRANPMSPREFKYGLLKLADPNDSTLISETVVARRLAAAYIDADEKTQLDCSKMLDEDLAAIQEEPSDDTAV